jgi:hypothetical protein
MAKSQETLLQEVVGQLRMLNKSSVRDRLRDAEDAKRAEKMQAMGEETNEQGTVAIDSATDFQRRYLAAQAGSLTDRALVDAPKGVLQKVIAKSSDKISRFTKDNLRYVKLMRWEALQKIRYDRKRDKNEESEDAEERRENQHILEGMILPMTEFLRGFVIRKERWEETKSVWKEAWAKFKWPIIFATLSAVYLAYEGMHSWGVKILGKTSKAVIAAKGWSTSWAAIVANTAKVRGAILLWFGYDKLGKPLSRLSPWQGGTIINFGAMHAEVGRRLTAIKTRAFRTVGLGPDGKPLKGFSLFDKQTFKGGPHGGTQTLRPAWQRTGSYAKVTEKIGKILSPMFRMGSAITKFFASSTGTVITKGLKAIGAVAGAVATSPFVTMLGKILWPISMFFALFNAFGSAKEEYGREGSNWFTIMGAGIGGFAGYVVGALVDLVKDGLIWIIKKAFGYETDENGQILKGQGFIGDFLGNAQEFSFQDLITSVITSAYRMVSDVVGWIVGLFTGTSYDGALWEWITNIPGKIVEWIKGYIPNWAKKALGMEITGAEVGTPEYKEQMMDWVEGKGKTAWSELYALSGIDPTLGKYKYVAGKADLRETRNAWLADPKNQKLLQDTYAQQLIWDDFLELRGIKEDKYLAGKGEFYTPKGSDTPIRITETTIINYLASVQGDQILGATQQGEVN